MLKVYEYKGCGTCRKAKKWIETHRIDCKEIPIREQPPSKTELKRMLKAYDCNIRKLFNTSGGDYKAMNLKNKLPRMSNDKAIALLAANGNLIKRPFVLSKDGCVIGFNEAEWVALLG